MRYWYVLLLMIGICGYIVWPPNTLHATTSADMIYSSSVPGTCLTSASAGSAITVETCRGLPSQYWTVSAQGTWSSQADASLCIAQTEVDGWNLHMASCSDALVIETEPNPDFPQGYRLKGTNLALDVYVDVKKLVLYPNHDGNNQQFYWLADDLDTLTRSASTTITYPLARTDTAAYQLDAVRDRVARIQPPFSVPITAIRNPEVFPGVVGESTRVTRSFSFNRTFRNHEYLRMSVPPQNWMSTGLYAAPGETVTVTVTGATTADMADVYVQLGVHTDVLYPDSGNVMLDGVFRRNPAITMTIKLEPGVNQVRTPYGGPIVLRSDRSYNKMLAVTIANAVQAPYFVRGVTTESEWLARRTLDVPFAEIESNGLVIHAPSSDIRTRTYAEMVEMTTHYDAVVTKINELAGLSPTAPLPHTAPQGKQRIAEDIQISGGWGHSGFPVMVYTAWSLLDPADVSRRADGWGVWHEIGHNYQMGAWADVMGGEVSVNWWSLYVEESLHGTSRLMLDDVYKRAQTRLNNPAITNKWQDADAFDQLTLFEQLRIAHPTLNWNMYTQMIRHYREISTATYDALDTDAKKTNYFVRILCGVTKTNVAPHFQTWSFALTNATTTACARQSAIRAPWLIDGTKSQHVGTGTGRVLYERWNAVAGSTIAQLTGTTAYPRYPTMRTIRSSALELTPLAVSNVGQRLRAYLHPPVSGRYRFWLAGDDTAQLRLSSSARSSDARTIITLTNATAYRGFTNQVQSQQRSVSINLQAGQRYYIEVLSQNASGDAHVSVAWEIPAGQGRVYESARPIEGKFLSPYVVDVAVSAPASVTAQPGTRFDLPVTIRHTGADVVSQAIIEALLPTGFRLPQNSQGWRSGYRYLRVIAQSEAGARGPWAAIAELTAFTTRGTAIPKSSWRLAHVSSEATQCDNGAARHAFDGDTTTYWHTDYCAHTPIFPHTLTVDMGNWYPLTGLSYTPRAATQNGNIGAYRILISVDGQHWIDAASGTFLDDGSTQRITITQATPLVRALAGPLQPAVTHTIVLPLIAQSQPGNVSLTVQLRAVHDRNVQPWTDVTLGNNRRTVTIQVAR